jgi:hypothetical protein
MTEAARVGGCFDQQEQQQSSSASASVKCIGSIRFFCSRGFGQHVWIFRHVIGSALEVSFLRRGSKQLIDPGELLQALAATSNGRLDEST